jgi:hypothetical protein
MEFVKSECPECGTPKKLVVSLSSDCGECGLDSFRITYEIPGEKIDAVTRAIFEVLDSNAMRPVAEYAVIPTYDDLRRRLGL